LYFLYSWSVNSWMHWIHSASQESDVAWRAINYREEYIHNASVNWFNVSRTDQELFKKQLCNKSSYFELSKDTIISCPPYSVLLMVWGERWNHSPGELERNLPALPARFGDLGIVNPARLSSIEYDASTKLTSPLHSLYFQVYVQMMLEALSWHWDLFWNALSYTLFVTTVLRSEVPVV